MNEWFKCCGFSRADDKTRCSSSQKKQSESGNTLNTALKVAWYGSELLGIGSFALQRPTPTGEMDEYQDRISYGSGIVDRAVVVEAIKQDFQSVYWVTGNLTLSVYEEDCEFVDPVNSFKGLRRFKRNTTNFGTMVEKANLKLTKWDDFEDKGIGHWQFSCVLSLPWRPIISATGYTEYCFDPKSGKICRHIENRNVTITTLIKQLLKPNRLKESKENN